MPYSTPYNPGPSQPQIVFGVICVPHITVSIILIRVRSLLLHIEEAPIRQGLKD
ncbi:hypothetical protein BD309DRAFT_964519 [Dichomitus squalens]|nr:hypothetical protein BD309DRAFT_964519 [Dichomitus squalens]